MKGVINRNKGKLAATGGGLSLLLALKLFVLRGEFEMMKEWFSEDHRLLMQMQVDGEHETVSAKNGFTNSVASGKVEP